MFTLPIGMATSHRLVTFHLMRLSALSGLTWEKRLVTVTLVRLRVTKTVFDVILAVTTRCVCFTSRADVFR